MNYRTFGSTGISLSEICFGTWRYASPDGKPDERSEAGGAALRRGLDAGINCIHSASEYGTRWLTGQVLRDHPKRKELQHVIKVNEPDFGDERFDAGRFRTKVEEALSELHTDRVAVVQHLQRGSAAKAGIYRGDDDDARIAEFDRDADEFRNAVERLKREGKMASLAGFPYTPRFARHAVASGMYDGLVIYFNILETEWMELFPEIERRGMGVIGIRPLCAGLLTDKRVDRSRLPDGDRLASDQWDEKYRQLAAIRSRMAQEPASWTQYAIAMSLSHPLVAASTLSINTEIQLEDALAAAENPYPPQAELEGIHNINKEIWEQTT